MARTFSYDLMHDHHLESDTGAYISSDPYWVIVVFPFANPITYDRGKLGAISADFDAVAKLRRQPIVITNDCVNLTINRSKASYTKDMNLSLIVNRVNYLSEVLPGDWVMAWMVHGKEKFDELKTRIGKLQACNKLDDGLKFVGRCHGPRMSVRVDRSTGKKVARCNIQCQSFTELAASFFYDPNLQASNDKSPLQWLAKLGVLSELFAKQFGEANNANIFIPEIINIVLGKGASKTVNPNTDEDGNSTRDDAANILPGAGGGTSPGAPAAYVLPAEVGQLLGATTTVNGKDYYTYADLLEVQMGVEQYEPPDNSQGLIVDGQALGEFGREVSFTAHNYGDRTQGNVVSLDPPLLGRFYFPPTFSNRSVWQQCQQFLNPAVNEMFTSLRIGANGTMTLALTARQIPFTTDAFKSPPDSKEVPVTKFLDMPRWKISPLMVDSLDIGRSDATRINYVHVYGNAYSYANKQTVSQQMGVNPPIRDDLDIIRNGVRTLMQTVECDVTDDKAQEHSQRTWMALIADWSMNSHLTLNGVIDCVGIQSPLSEGQNVEFDGVVYHVEAISETAHIDPEGRKSWQTRLSLSNGILANENESSKRSLYPGYAGLVEPPPADNDSPDDEPGSDVLQDLQTIDNITNRIRPAWTKTFAK